MFGVITPADGTVIAATEVTLAGNGQDAVNLEINGDPETDVAHCR